MADNYTDAALEQAPGWLKGELGESWWQLWGGLKDALLAGAKAAVKQRYPASSSPAGLEAIGQDRQLERMPDEPEGAYVARLEAAFDTAQWGGTAKGVRDALILTRLFDPVIGLDGDYDSPDVVANWRWDPGSPLWARFWVVIEQPHVFKAPRTYGSGAKYGQPPVGDGIFYGFTGATGEQSRLLRRAVALTMGGHNRCMAIIILISGTLYGGGKTYGDGTVYGTKTARLPVP